MPAILQLVYASRATFRENTSSQGIEPEVSRILMQSRQNNPRSGIVGALYYGDGHFFQCLEGEPEAVRGTLERIRRDDRHEEVRVLREQSLESPGFGEWSMKYVPAAVDVRQLLQRFGQRQFDPFAFDDDRIDAMLDLLRQGRDNAPAEGAGSTGGKAEDATRGANRALFGLGLAAAAIVAGVIGAAAWLLLAG
ncbi:MULTISPECIES: BLUF domain-containing protein [unclassified Thioalkalivibrio]|uniref:BLUF domain-containing protein n=1 Tax=unclassified Thioalkalivibrio TaxID=2621013 RepID=UPI00036A2F75|nr:MULTISPECIES: BLUF domain-containing protein [unclassified Thioalkalivibrio]